MMSLEVKTFLFFLLEFAVASAIIMILYKLDLIEYPIRYRVRIETTRRRRKKPQGKQRHQRLRQR